MNNEQEFFSELLKLEKIQLSTPLTKAEARQIFWDVADGHHSDPFFELVRRIEYAHGIGVYHD
jgi:hypothetical protein